MQPITLHVAAKARIQRQCQDTAFRVLYRRILDAGKKVALVGFSSYEELAAMRQEFGADFSRFFLRMNANKTERAERIIEAAGG